MSRRISRKLTGSASYIVLVLIVSRIMSWTSIRVAKETKEGRTSPSFWFFSMISGGSDSSSSSLSADVRGRSAGGAAPRGKGRLAGTGCTAAMALMSQSLSLPQRHTNTSLGERFKNRPKSRGQWRLIVVGERLA